jgi:hypothetical protein
VQKPKIRKQNHLWISRQNPQFVALGRNKENVGISQVNTQQIPMVSSFSLLTRESQFSSRPMAFTSDSHVTVCLFRPSFQPSEPPSGQTRKRFLSKSSSSSSSSSREHSELCGGGGGGGDGAAFRSHLQMVAQRQSLAAAAGGARNQLLLQKEEEEKKRSCCCCCFRERLIAAPCATYPPRAPGFGHRRI